LFINSNSNYNSCAADDAAVEDKLAAGGYMLPIVAHDGAEVPGVARPVRPQSDVRRMVSKICPIRPNSRQPVKRVKTVVCDQRTQCSTAIMLGEEKSRRICPPWAAWVGWLLCAQARNAAVGQQAAKVAMAAHHQRCGGHFTAWAWQCSRRRPPGRRTAYVPLIFCGFQS